MKISMNKKKVKDNKVKVNYNWANYCINLSFNQTKNFHLIGTIYYANGDQYEGDYKNGIRKGKGKIE